MNATIPTPAIFANRKATVATLDPADSGKIVRPGLVDQTIDLISDGVVKAKHLKPGQHVRPFVKGEPRGSERVVGKVTPIDDGAFVRIEWESAHPTSEHKAAYRWHDASLDGATVKHVVKRPGFVAYQES